MPQKSSFPLHHSQFSASMWEIFILANQKDADNRYSQFPPIDTIDEWCWSFAWKPEDWSINKNFVSIQLSLYLCLLVVSYESQLTSTYTNGTFCGAIAVPKIRQTTVTNDQRLIILLRFFLSLVMQATAVDLLTCSLSYLRM